MVNYLSAHDDWTLWDRLVYTGDEQLRFQMCHSELLRQNRLAAAINFSCQGQLFLLSGEEFARTKQGIQNSYRSPLETNQLDWSRAWINHDLVEYYKGLIALRMHLPGLQDKTHQAAERILSVTAPSFRSDLCKTALSSLLGVSPASSDPLFYANHPRKSL